MVNYPWASEEMRSFIVVLLIAGCVGAGLVLLGMRDVSIRPGTEANSPIVHHEPGEKVDSYRSVPVFENGKDIRVSHGKHYAEGGYYYGQKWQCVEYVKRFYHDALDHKMPSVWGHARDFYDPEVQHGRLNEQRGLVQYQNGGSVQPKVNDLLVFRNGSLGHVAIVSNVTASEIEVVQQNVRGHSRQRHRLQGANGRYTITGSNAPAGWLRLPE